MILHNRIQGRSLVNTGTSLLGTIRAAATYEYLIPADVNTLTEPDVLRSTCRNEPYYIRHTYLITVVDNFQLHKPGNLCVLIVTVLKNRLLYQVYNTPSTSGVNESWYLVYEEVVPVDMQIAPAANISLGLSALQLRGVYDREF